jgi:hypothetical protein
MRIPFKPFSPGSDGLPMPTNVSESLSNARAPRVIFFLKEDYPWGRFDTALHENRGRNCRSMGGNLGFTKNIFLVTLGHSTPTHTCVNQSETDTSQE